MIHCIGDSHLENFWISSPDIFKTEGTRAITAYKYGERFHEQYKQQFDKIPEGSKILLSFGEIDCCLHVRKYADKLSRSIEETIGNSLEKYKIAIEWIGARYKVAVYGTYPHQYYPQEEVDSEITHIGGFYEVMAYKIIFNYWLKKICNECGVFYFGLMAEAITDKWYMFPDKTYYRDRTHIGEFSVPLAIEKLKQGGFIETA